jgi:transmembrane sensor
MIDRSKSDSPAMRQPTPVERAALGWVVRSERGLTPEQKGEFRQWLEASTEHRALFEEFGGTWSLLGRAEESCHPEAEIGGRAYSTSTGGARRRSLWIHWKVWLPLAAAAAIAIAFVGPRRPQPDATPIATEVGAMRDLQLSDGSIVKLNTDTVLTTVFTAGERRVRLVQGEAYFEVAKDAARPFVVEAAGLGVRALGTAFNVRVRPESIEVLVPKGRVRVGQGESMAAVKPGAPATPGVAVPAASAELGAGERAIVPIAARAAAGPMTSLAVGRVTTDELRRALAWQERRLEFSDTLRYAVGRDGGRVQSLPPAQTGRGGRFAGRAAIRRIVSPG